MWNETEEITALREALGLMSAHLLAVSPARDVTSGANGSVRERLGLLAVFEYVMIYDSNPSATLRGPQERETSTNDTSKDGLCRWFADESTSVSRDSESGTSLTVLVGGAPSFTFVWVDSLEVIYNAASWVFDWAARRGSRDISRSELSAVLYPEATARWQRLLQQRRTKDESGVVEFVIADLSGAIVTNVRLFFATSVINIGNVEFMQTEKSHVIIILNKYTKIKLRCSAFRQSLLLRIWMDSILRLNDKDRNDNSAAATLTDLRMMLSLHRQFCAIAPMADGRLDRLTLTQFMQPLFRTSFFVDGLFRILDRDGSGLISYATFAAKMLDLLSKIPERRARTTFALCDENNDHSISSGELRNMLGALQHTGGVIMSLSCEELDAVSAQLFDLLDVDHDGQISVLEYIDGYRRPDVYATLCRLGLAGERVAQQRIELVSALSTPSKLTDWGLLGDVMRTLRWFVDELYFASSLSTPQSIDGLQKPPIAHCADRFRLLHRHWGLTVAQFEDCLGIDNIAANLILGVKNLPKITSHTPRRLISADGRMSVFEIPADVLQGLVALLPEYTEYVMHRCPQSALCRLVGLISFADNKGHLCIISHPHCQYERIMRLPSPVTAEHIYFDPGWCDLMKAVLRSDIKFLSAHALTGVVLVSCERDSERKQILRASPPPQSSAPVDGNHRERVPSSCSWLPLCCRVDPSHLTRSAPSAEHQLTYDGGAVPIRRRKTQIKHMVPERGPLSDVTAAGRKLQITLHFLCSFDSTVADGMCSEEPPLAAADDLFHAVNAAFKEVPVALLPTPDIGEQCITVHVTIFNGRKGELTLDRGARILYLTSDGRSIFSVSLRMSYGLSLVRAKFAYLTPLDRRRLLFRAEPDPEFVRYRVSTSVEFETVEDLERLSSYIFRGTGGGNLSGMQCLTMQLLVLHWNVGGANPPENLASLFAAVTESTQLVVVSASECVFQSPGRAVTLSCQAEWTARVMAQLGSSFALLSVVSCGATRIIVACRSGRQAHVSGIEEVKHTVLSDQGRAVGACVCLSLQLEQTPISFISLALKPGAPSAVRVKYLEGVFAAFSKALKRPVDVLNSHYCTFLIGDFNFGTTMPATEVVRRASWGEYAALLPHDSLLPELRAGGSLSLFEEPRIDFAPTSTFVRNVTSSTKARIYDEWNKYPPSWSTRILRKCLGHPLDCPRCLAYGAISSLLTSSHNAVYALLDVPVRQQYVMMHMIHRRTRCVKLSVFDLRCEELAAEGTSGDLQVRFVNPYVLRDETSVMRGTTSRSVCAAVNAVVDIALEGIESALFYASYLTFAVIDVDARGTENSLGEAVTPLLGDLENRREVEAPVMRYGRRCGLLRCALQLVTA